MRIMTDEWLRRPDGLRFIYRERNHHFFTVDEHGEPAMRDDKGRILVYLNRQKAIDDAHAKYGNNKTLITIGMGDEKWTMFKQMEQYVLVE